MFKSITQAKTQFEGLIHDRLNSDFTIMWGTQNKVLNKNHKETSDTHFLNLLTFFRSPIVLKGITTLWREIFMFLSNMVN